jgi:hypothetical protein
MAYVRREEAVVKASRALEMIDEMTEAELNAFRMGISVAIRTADDSWEGYMKDPYGIPGPQNDSPEAATDYILRVYYTHIGNPLRVLYDAAAHRVLQQQLEETIKEE